MSHLHQLELKQEAAQRLFAYLYLLRYGREPEVWEWTLGWALITGALVVERPLLLKPLSQVHAVAHDIGRALSLIDRSSGKPLKEETRGCGPLWQGKTITIRPNLP